MSLSLGLLLIQDFLCVYKTRTEISLSVVMTALCCSILIKRLINDKNPNKRGKKNYEI